MAGLTAGITEGLSDSLNLNVPGVDKVNLTDRMKHGMLQASVRTATESAIQGGKVMQRLASEMVAGTVEAVGGHLSEQIGDRRQSGEIGSLRHKLEHAFVGGVSGGVRNTTRAVLNGEDIGRAAFEGLGAGAFGAIVSEIVAEQMANRLYERVAEEAFIEFEASDLSREEFNVILESRLIQATQAEKTRIATVSKLSTVGLAFVSGIDVETAHEAGSTAVENNAIPHIIGGALMVGAAGLTAYDAYKAYQGEGYVGALKSLAVDGFVTVATGGVLKFGGKLIKPLANGAWQYGTKVFPSAELAFNAIVKENKLFGKIFNRFARNAPSKLESNVISRDLRQVGLFRDLDISMFSKSDRRSIRNLNRQIKAHIEKLELYKRNPYLFDNKGFLRNAPNPDKVIQGRIRHLENEIRNFDESIKKIIIKY